MDGSPGGKEKKEDEFWHNEIDSCCAVACRDEERKDEKDVTFKKVEE